GDPSPLFLGALHTKEPVVVTKYETLQGKQMHMGKTPVNVFLGVPVSTPPVLQGSWGQITSMYVNTQKQYKWLRFSEDCLYLNVYAPVHARGDSPLPAPHCPAQASASPGGTFLTGSSSTHDGFELAAPEQVVIMLLQSRLGVLGFLRWAGPGTRAGSPLDLGGGSTGWRERDVVHGGETTWQGRSLTFGPRELGPAGPGCGSVLGAEKHRSLWRRRRLCDPVWPVIRGHVHLGTDECDDVTPSLRSLPSGHFPECTAVLRVFITSDSLKVAKMGGSSPPGLSKEGQYGGTPKHLFSPQKVACLVGCNHKSTWILVDCLRAQSGAEVMRVSKKMRFFHLNSQEDPQEITWFMRPMVDGVVVSDDPVVLLIQGQVASVPCLLSVNNLEFSWLLPFVSGCFLLYLYVFEPHTSTNIIIKPRTDGADHGDEICFIFRSPFSKVAKAPPDTPHWVSGLSTFVFGPTSPLADHRELARQPPSLEGIVEGAGNPTDEKLPYWPCYSQKYLQLDFTTKVGVKLKEEKMVFWMRLCQH
ncbi:hypothetical protein HPG69_000225, partial [Diceros bicornis minor]